MQSSESRLALFDLPCTGEKRSRGTKCAAFVERTVSRPYLALSLSLSLFLYSSVWDDRRIEIARTGPSLISAVNPSDTLFRNFDLLGRCTVSRSTRDNVTLGEAAAIRYDSIASDKEAFQFDRLCEVKFPIEEDRRSWDFSIHGTSAKDVAQYTGRAKKSSHDRSAGDSTWENKRRRKFIMYDLLHLLLYYYYY